MRMIYHAVWFIMLITMLMRGSAAANTLNAPEGSIRLTITNLTEEYRANLALNFEECKTALENYIRSIPCASLPAELTTRYDDDQRILISVLTVHVHLGDSVKAFGKDMFGFDPEYHAINIHPVAAMLEHLHNYYAMSNQRHLLAAKFVKSNGDWVYFIADYYQNRHKIFRLLPLIIIGTKEGTYTINTACPMFMNSWARKFCLPNPKLPSGKMSEAALLWNFFKVKYKPISYASEAQ